MNPTNQGNTNIQTRGRGSTGVEGIGIEVEIKAFIKIDLPFVGDIRNVSQEEAQHGIHDCPIYEECTENWWKTHPTNSNTTTSSNLEQEENLEGNPLKRCNRVPSIMMIHLKRISFMSHIHRQKVLGENNVKNLW